MGVCAVVCPKSCTSFWGEKSFALKYKLDKICPLVLVKLAMENSSNKSTHSENMLLLSEAIAGREMPPGLRARTKSAIEFRSLLLNESDRGCALMAAAYLDDLLMKLLQGCLALNSEMKVKMFDFNGPLGTFSSRISMAYAIGKLPPSLRTDLTTIRNIRNKFAHNAAEMSFNTPVVLSLIRKLKYHPHDKHHDANKIFVTVTMGIMGFLSDPNNMGPAFKPPADLDLKKMQEMHTAFKTKFDLFAKAGASGDSDQNADDA